jgi:hypothetical protein
MTHVPSTTQTTGAGHVSGGHASAPLGSLSRAKETAGVVGGPNPVAANPAGSPVALATV